jgi:hypothetical protein
MAGANEGKATAEGELSVTVTDLKESTSTLASTQSECMTVASDHETAVRARAGELKVIKQAVKIIQDTTGGAQEQTYSFIQARRISSQSAQQANVIAAMVKKLARKHHSNALAQLASRITAVVRYGRAGSHSDPFVKIRGLIKDMISKLEQEAGDEATEKAYCDEEMSKTKTKKGELEANIEKLSTKIDQNAAKSAELKDEVKVLQSELANLAKQQQEMDRIRAENHAVYVKAKADLEQGLGGIRKALTILRDYYAAGSAASASLVQDGTQLSEMMEQPAAPADHEKSGGAGASIIGILEVAESDMATNLAKVETLEDDEQSAYDKGTQENKVVSAEKNQDAKYKTQEFTSLDKTMTELTGDKETFDAELSAVLEYYTKLKGRCVAKPETYEERKKRREAEIQGLKEALDILESEAALVQRSSSSKRRPTKSMRGALQL